MPLNSGSVIFANTVSLYLGTEPNGFSIAGVLAFIEEKYFFIICSAFF